MLQNHILYSHKMSHESATSIASRVQSIKSKFESLNSLESLDITGPTVKKQPKSSFLFQRSATALDLSAIAKIPFNGNVGNAFSRASSATTTAPIITTKPSSSTALAAAAAATKTTPNKSKNKSMEVQRQASDSFLLKNRTVIVRDKLKPLKEIKENVEVRLSRHTSDPIKRSSIKRSPAFRVNSHGGDNKNVNNKLPLTKSVSIPKEFSEKFDELLKRCAPEVTEQSSEIGLTDTLKAALKQPLPTGPPPKKPPRTFESPSPKDDINPITLFLNHKVTNGDHSVVGTVETADPSAELKSRINYLEQNLMLNSDTTATGVTAIKQRAHGTKEKSHILSNSLLSCIPCSSPLYDSVNVQTNGLRPLVAKSQNGHQQQSHQSHPHNQISNGVTTATAKNGNAIEPIYMEPFGHLKMKATTAANPSHVVPDNHVVADANDTNEKLIMKSAYDLDMSKATKTCSTCVEHQTMDRNGDSHYLCTNIDNNMKSTDDHITLGEHDSPMALKSTYDEINVLVNAAYGQHKQSAGNSLDTGDSSSTTSSTSSNNQHKSAIKLYRTLTEKRKDYVRRISTNPNADNVSNYGTVHRTFKPNVLKTFSFDNTHEYDIPNCENDADETMASSLPSTTSTSQRIAKYNQMINETVNTSIVSRHNGANTDGASDKSVELTAKEDDLANTAGDEDRPKLFQVCLLIGYNTSNGAPYIKSKYPADEDVPQNIEQLVFPSRKLINQTKIDQEYSIILTDDSGYRIYGYCRRVVPESSDICLPLAYCLICETKAPGFFFKVLAEIESRHGQTDVQTNSLLENLQNLAIPDAGKFLHIKLPLSPQPKSLHTATSHKITPKRLSLEVNPKWLTEAAAQAAFNTDTIESTSSSGKKDKSNFKSVVQEFEEKKLAKHSISVPQPPFDFNLINRSLLGSGQRGDEFFVRRPNDLRLESTELSDLYAALRPELLIAVFGSLLLERKVILFSQHISRLSSCVLGLQTVLYPFQWQHTLVTILPQELVEVCQAPFPVLAGMLEPIQFDIEDALIINLDNRAVTQKCDDEATILPATLRDSLKVSLDMVDLLDQGRMLSSVLIAEAFLRFFVELFAGYKHKHFDKKLFIDSHSSQTVRLFLEWFTETAMFRHFISNKFPASHDQQSTLLSRQDPTLYDLFDARLLEKSENKTKPTQNMENIMKNCRLINKKARTFKERFKVFMNNGKKGDDEAHK